MRCNNIREFYETVYPRQEEYFHLLDYASSFRMNLIRGLLVRLNGKTVVDVGCGSGSVSFLLGSLGASVHSVDISRKALRVTRRLGWFVGLETHVCNADAARLPFREEIFDVLCCLETLEHLPDDLLAIKEFARILKPEGIIVLSVPYLNRQDSTRLTIEEKSLGHFRVYNHETIKRRLCCKEFHLERVIFWRFPIIEFLDLIRIRMLFAILGVLIEATGNPDSKLCFSSLRNHDVFVHSLVKFYRTKFWRRALLPLLMYMSRLDKLFQNLPCSGASSWSLGSQGAI